MVLPSEIASIASAVSGLAATVSLIYVGIQIRLRVRHTKALIQQGTTARTTNILLGGVSAEAAAVWIEGNGGTPTPELIPERQFQNYCGIAMIAMEGQHLRYGSPHPCCGRRSAPALLVKKENVAGSTKAVHPAWSKHETRLKIVMNNC